MRYDWATNQLIDGPGPCMCASPEIVRRVGNGSATTTCAACGGFVRDRSTRAYAGSVKAPSGAGREEAMSWRNA